MADEEMRPMAFGMPDIGKMQGQMNEKFDQLVARLDALGVLLVEIRDELRRQGASG